MPLMSSSHAPAPPRHHPYVLLSLAALQWGANIIMSRLAVGQIAPMLLGSLRWLIVLVLLAAFYRREILADWPKLRRHLGLLTLLSVSGFTGFTAFFYVSAHFTGATNMSIIQGATPLFVFTLAYFAHGERVGFARVLGMALALAGVGIVATQGSLAALRALSFNIGDLFMIAATFCYSVYTVWLAKRPQAGAMAIFAVMAAIAFVTSLPLAGIELATVPVGWPTPFGWLLTLLIALFPTFVAQIFFMHGVEAVGPGRAGIFVNLIPVFGAGMAVLLLGEPFGWYQATGLGLVMLGIVCAQKTAPR